YTQQDLLLNSEKSEKEEEIENTHKNNNSKEQSDYSVEIDVSWPGSDTDPSSLPIAGEPLYISWKLTESSSGFGIKDRIQVIQLTGTNGLEWEEEEEEVVVCVLSNIGNLKKGYR